MSDKLLAQLKFIAWLYTELEMPLPLDLQAALDSEGLTINEIQKEAEEYG